ncbi:MAG: hypothetical protein LAT64_02105 [Phycisphaerales bacterium]|nr:hypothetical protein [Planctomycetota bacterium]MCH8507551.1 hypothetical protein [Phycisphaerales bacterium]
MLEPAPTTKIDPTLARGTLSEIVPATATKPAYMVLTVPNTDYRLHLRPFNNDMRPFEGREGQKVIGRVRVEARRVDVCGAGGRLIEPCFGRPRRVQGMVRGTVPQEGSIVVSAGVPVHLVLTAPGQTPDRFREGDFVTCDVKDGASFELVG